MYIYILSLSLPISLSLYIYICTYMIIINTEKLAVGHSCMPEYALTWSFFIPLHNSFTFSTMPMHACIHSYACPT